MSLNFVRGRLRPRVAAATIVLALGLAPRADALERLCDSSFENCRNEVLDRIRAEVVEISVAAWFFEDFRFSHELIQRFNAGVTIRVLGDPRANLQHPINGDILDHMAAAGIPIRKKVTSGIEHWKLMLFAGQGVAYFGAANFSDDAFVPVDPYRNYVDETIYGTDDPSIVDSFKTKYDEAWIDTTHYANYANAPNASLARHYPIYPIDPELNWAPAFGSASYRSRSVAAYAAETKKIDVIMYRITDQAHVDALIAAHQRGVPIRFYHEQRMYREPSQLWHAMSIDKLYLAGVPIRERAHAGLNHQKLVLLYGQQLTIFGSSNMTSKSSDSQHEHNYFTAKPHIFSWFVDQFERKWNNTNPLGVPETKPFAPLPPDEPVYQALADGSVGVATSGVTLEWHGGLWAHLYDVYFGTTPDPPLFAPNRALGPSRYPHQNQTFVLPPLAAGTTYYWRVVSKTLAHLSRSGPVRSFTTAGSAPPPPAGAGNVVLWAAAAPVVRGDWVTIADPTAAGGAALHNPDRGRAKIATALASPENYFEISFEADAGVAYHLWLRMRAEHDSYANDSVHVQFSDAVDLLGTPLMRIGTAGSADVVLQAGPGASTPQQWGWTDNGWGVLGVPIYFAGSATRVIRVQQREDGAVIDQIVLSPASFLTSPPGARRFDATILPASGASTGGGGAPPPAPASTIVLHPGQPGVAAAYGSWQRTADAAAASGALMQNPDAGDAKIAPALAGPADYIELQFTAEAGRPYHLWLRMRAEADGWMNDSVHVQFNGAVTASGAPYARIGSIESAEVVLQEAGGPAPRGWGWTDNGWGAPGPHVYFATTGVQTLRIQQREDGAMVDQVVLSADTYLLAAPGARRDDATVLAAAP